jgi:HPt (histidine-containing phosphotransfer) domain-containing protein
MIMDPAAVTRLQEMGGPALVRTLVRLVLEELPSRLACVEAAVKAHDPAELAPAAHSLISTTGNFGAFQVSELARRIELAAPAGDWRALGADAAELVTLTRQFLQELEAVRMQVDEDTRG